MKTHTIFEEPGEYGINRLIDAAQRKEQNGSFEMTWTSKAEPSFNLKVNFRLISGNSSGNIGSSRGYAGLQLVDKVVTDKAVRVVSAQAMPTNVAVTQPAKSHLFSSTKDETDKYQFQSSYELAIEQNE